MKKTTTVPPEALPTEEERATLAAAEAATVTVTFADLGLSEPMLEALRDAWRSKKATADELWHHAKVCRVANIMRPYLEAVVQ